MQSGGSDMPSKNPTPHDLHSQHEADKALKADLQIRVAVSDRHQITDFIAE